MRLGSPRVVPLCFTGEAVDLITFAQNNKLEVEA